eukprot:TRINITY_DN75839_c0_g1_i1.p1 TRINITY_DN75839_c0_g1~~TRINITY_DN75839_c0_g1_i1.p1  ORF type:complete len:492 (+),score=62.11 TRINITY_DN75839_c0_g1_i1:226-1701(+)
MGGVCGFSSNRRAELLAEETSCEVPCSALPSAYQQCVSRLAQAAIDKPPEEPLEATLRACIAFCYGGGREWAPHVRVQVYADNPIENQSNVPVYLTLLQTWGVSGFNNVTVKCQPIPGTDVQDGYVRRSLFWQRKAVPINGSHSVKTIYYRDVIHQLLDWFIGLPDDDCRKQLLVNMLLQLHEACFNCVGRHKEVFEYCIHDFIDAQGDEETNVLASSPSPQYPSSVHPQVSPALEGPCSVIRRFASIYLDRHKRDALHGAILSPLKFLFQENYEVFENMDSHGASFWVGALSSAFFPRLEMPFEKIVELDKGWSWAAVDFLRVMTHGDALKALELFGAVENLGSDWRSLSRGLVPPTRKPGCLPCVVSASIAGDGFTTFVSKARVRNSRLRQALAPYAVRFGSLLTQSVLLRRFTLAAVSSVAWDASLGPSFAALSMDALGVSLSPHQLREKLVGDCLDAGAIEINEQASSALLGVVGIDWASTSAQSIT